MCHRMARLAVGHVPGNPGTSATLFFHSPHTQAEKVNPVRSRSTDKDDTTKVSDSQILIILFQPSELAICRAAGVSMMIIMVGNINKAIGMIILIGAL